MKLLSSSEIRQADAQTIAHEPVASIDLMERAAAACFEWITLRFDKANFFKIFCGTGNNGGDGLAIARMMIRADYTIETFVIRYSDKSSEDFNTNEQRLLELNPEIIRTIKDEKDFPPLKKDDVVIDAIFGTGFSKPTEGLVASCIRHINRSASTVIAIDLPSGLFADKNSNPEDAIIHATNTLSFQAPKLAFMFAENDPYVGDWEILDIKLDKKFIENLPSSYFVIDDQLAKSLLKARPKFSHKGMYGHALLVAGSFGKMGAAVLASRACLKSGIGLLTVHIPGCGYEIMQAAVPEAMVQVDADEHVYSSEITLENFNALGIGCGIGSEIKTRKAWEKLLASVNIPLVIDADAINMLALDTKKLNLLPQNSILTPHLKEFERISGKAKNDFHRHEMQIEFAHTYKVYVVLKGAHTCIACPDGKVYFNNTGNPGMAKGGSGDALTGIILSLLAQNYSPEQACILGVFLHGSAGDIAAEKNSSESMLASDLIQNIGDAFLKLRINLKN
jgi:hydroxyethylthiazole kinase-like uncharacterized protein yjeF